MLRQQEVHVCVVIKMTFDLSNATMTFQLTKVTAVKNGSDTTNAQPIKTRQYNTTDDKLFSLHGQYKHIHNACVFYTVSSD